VLPVVNRPSETDLAAPADWRMFDYGFALPNQLRKPGKAMKKLIAFALLLAVSAGAFAQTIDEVMTKHVAALGGIDKITAIKAAECSQSMSVQGMELDGKTTIVVGHSSRTDVSVMGQTITNVIDEETGWMLNPLMGGSSPVDLPAEQVKLAKDNTNIMGLQLVMAQMQHKTISLAGHETYNGADALKVLVSEGDTKSTYFLNPTDYTIIAIKNQVNANGQTVDLNTALSDYKDESGLLLPHTTVTSIMGQDITIKMMKFTANPAIDPTFFNKPATK
jgi:hypothetical protein